VWGVVYEIDDVEIGTLDRLEGYLEGRSKNSYLRREGNVFFEGDETRLAKVFIYFAFPQPDAPAPNAEYKAMIVGGARYWHLPREYVKDLEAIRVSDEPPSSRATEGSSGVS
jgi:hypothetical protein